MNTGMKSVYGLFVKKRHFTSKTGSFGMTSQDPKEKKRHSIMDSVTLELKDKTGTMGIIVDKSYWQNSFLQQIDNYVTLGTSKQAIQLFLKFNSINALNLSLKTSCQV